MAGEVSTQCMVAEAMRAMVRADGAAFECREHGGMSTPGIFVAPGDYYSKVEVAADGTMYLVLECPGLDDVFMPGFDQHEGNACTHALANIVSGNYDGCSLGCTMQDSRALVPYRWGGDEAALPALDTDVRRMEKENSSQHNFSNFPFNELEAFAVKQFALSTEVLAPAPRSSLTCSATDLVVFDANGLLDEERGEDDDLLRASAMFQGWDDLGSDLELVAGMTCPDCGPVICSGDGFDSFDVHGGAEAPGDFLMRTPLKSCEHNGWKPCHSDKLNKKYVSSVTGMDDGVPGTSWTQPTDMSSCTGYENHIEDPSVSPSTPNPWKDCRKPAFRNADAVRNLDSSKQFKGAVKANGKSNSKANGKSPAKANGNGVKIHGGKSIKREPSCSASESEESESDDDEAAAGPSKSGIAKSGKWSPQKYLPGKKCKGSSKVQETWKEFMTDRGQDVADNDRKKVIQALYTFEELRQNFIEIETVRAEKGRAEGQHCRVRPDLRASMQMRVDGLRVNTNHYIGSVPGIRIGDHFWYRIEMVIVGLHQQLEAGIAYIGKGNSPIEGVPLATSVVMKHSGNPYQDDNESGDIITYTGQGGLSHRSSGAHSVTDQVLTRGNEALKNSCQHRKPIRVIRGHKDKQSPTGESYTYIGLYEVLAMRYETGVQGMRVYKFDLCRSSGQPPLNEILVPAPTAGTNKASSSKCAPMKGKGSAGPEYGKGKEVDVLKRKRKSESETNLKGGGKMKGFLSTDSPKGQVANCKR